MKTLTTLFLTISTISFAQQFNSTDFLLINKLSIPQLEAKYNLTPIETKNDGKKIYKISSDNKERLLTVQEKNDKISKAQLYIGDTTIDDGCSTLSYAFHKALKNEELVITVNSKKIDIPYFNYEEFIDAVYKKNKNDIDVDNTVKSSYKSFGSEFSIIRVTGKCSVFATSLAVNETINKKK